MVGFARIYSTEEDFSRLFLLFRVSARGCSIKIHVLRPRFSLGTFVFFYVLQQLSSAKLWQLWATSLPGSDDDPSDLPNPADLGLSKALLKAAFSDESARKSLYRKNIVLTNPFFMV